MEIHLALSKGFGADGDRDSVFTSVRPKSPGFFGKELPQIQIFHRLGERNLAVFGGIKPAFGSTSWSDKRRLTPISRGFQASLRDPQAVTMKSPFHRTQHLRQL